MEEIYELEAAKLQRCVESGVQTVLYTINGYQLHGRVVDYDRNVIIMDSNGEEKMVYRHAVSTIVLPNV